MQFLGLTCMACRTYKLSDPDRFPCKQEHLTAIHVTSCSGRIVPVVSTRSCDLQLEGKKSRDSLMVHFELSFM